jgi:hypothetical protein
MVGSSKYDKAGGDFFRDGNIITEKEFNARKRQYLYDLADIEFKNLTDTLYDTFEVTGNVVKLPQKYDTPENNDTLFSAIASIKNVAADIEGAITDTDRAELHRSAVGGFLILNRNFIPAFVQKRFKGRHINWNTGSYDEGTTRTTARFVGDFFKAVYNDKLNFVSASRAVWGQLEPFEKQNIARTVADLVFLAGIYVLCALVGVWAPDDEDEAEKDKPWGQQALQYLLLRTSFEQASMWNPNEILQILNSPTAANNMIEGLFALPNMLDIFTPVRSGVYKDKSKAFRW